MSGIEKFLGSLELTQYLESFVDNGIDMENLSELTDQDLQDLGVEVLGHRKTIVKAIRQQVPLDEQPQPEPSRSTEVLPLLTESVTSVLYLVSILWIVGVCLPWFEYHSWVRSNGSLVAAESVSVSGGLLVAGYMALFIAVGAIVAVHKRSAQWAPLIGFLGVLWLLFAVPLIQQSTGFESSHSVSVRGVGSASAGTGLTVSYGLYMTCICAALYTAIALVYFRPSSTGAEPAKIFGIQMSKANDAIDKTPPPVRVLGLVLLFGVVIGSFWPGYLRLTVGNNGPPEDSRSQAEGRVDRRGEQARGADVPGPGAPEGPNAEVDQISSHDGDKAAPPQEDFENEREFEGPTEAETTAIRGILSFTGRYTQEGTINSLELVDVDGLEDFDGTFEMVVSLCESPGNLEGTYVRDDFGVLMTVTEVDWAPSEIDEFNLDVVWDESSEPASFVGLRLRDASFWCGPYEADVLERD